MQEAPDLHPGLRYLLPLRLLTAALRAARAASFTLAAGSTSHRRLIAVAAAAGCFGTGQRVGGECPHGSGKQNRHGERSDFHDNSSRCCVAWNGAPLSPDEPGAVPSQRNGLDAHIGLQGEDRAMITRGEAWIRKPAIEPGRKRSRGYSWQCLRAARRVLLPVRNCGSNPRLTRRGAATGCRSASRCLRRHGAGNHLRRSTTAVRWILVGYMAGMAGQRQDAAVQGRQWQAIRPGPQSRRQQHNACDRPPPRLDTLTHAPMISLCLHASTCWRSRRRASIIRCRRRMRRTSQKKQTARSRSCEPFVVE
jgi:hypothetical protein